MLFTLDLDSPIPLYQQIRDQVVAGLAMGRLHDGEALPTIRQFAADFGINLHTVRKAYEILEREGFVRVQRQRGVVVSRTGRRDTGTPEWESRLHVLLAEEYAHGQTRDEILARCRRVLASFTGARAERTTEA